MRASARALFKRALLLALGIAALIGAAWLSERYPWRVDLSSGQRASLSVQAQAVLGALSGPVEVVSYARDAGSLRGSIAAFVARWQRVKPDFTLRFVDPDDDPAAMRALGVTLDGEIALNYAGRSQRLTQLSEREFAQALLRLAREGAQRVTFLTGHGERRSDGDANADLGRFAAALAADGIAIESLNLAAQTQVPDNAGVLVLASPETDYTDAETAQLIDWIGRGGALLWFTEPGPERGLEALFRALGIVQLAGQVVDATGQGLGVGDPSFVAITRYPEHRISRGFDLTALLPQTAAFARRPDAAFAATPLATSSTHSWTETGSISGDIAFDADSAEFPGPLDMALALERLSPGPGREQQRVVVVGDGDFLSNRFIGNGGNRTLGVRMVNWLLADDDLIDIDTVAAPDQSLELTPRSLGLIGLWWLVLVPALLALTGAIVVWRRRRQG